MSLNVLIVEDNAVDAMLLQQALAREAVCAFTVIDQGDEAVEYLRSAAEEAPAARPGTDPAGFEPAGRGWRRSLQLCPK